MYKSIVSVHISLDLFCITEYNPHSINKVRQYFSEHVSTIIKEQHSQAKEHLYLKFKLYKKSNIIRNCLNCVAEVVSDIIYSGFSRYIIEVKVKSGLMIKT